MSKQTNRPGRIILGMVAGMTAAGGFAADWNSTHLFNPEWPPHAKFHDAMSITLGSLLGVSGLYFLLRKGTDQKQDIRMGTVLPAMFWLAQGLSFIYPGARGLEAEFPELIPRIKGIWLDEKFASAGMLTLSGIGYNLEINRFHQQVHEKATKNEG